MSHTGTRQAPRLSREFYATLEPRRGLRRFVFVAALLCHAWGVVIIGCMSVPAAWRVVFLTAWLVSCGSELVSRRRNQARIWRIKINNRGEVVVAAGPAHQVAVQVLSGTTVIRRYAWIRFRFPDGQKYGELLAGDPAADRQWHRFQLIWQQCRSRIVVAPRGVDP